MLKVVYGANERSASVQVLIELRVLRSVLNPSNVFTRMTVSKLTVSVAEHPALMNS